jgi:hypothetical protein
MLDLLTNPYGFLREMEGNIVNNAQYTKIPVEEFREKLMKALDSYVAEHEKLPTYNRAQELAKLAATSIGRLQVNRTIMALKELEKHLNSKDEWVAFAHENLD